ncbi:hypothetical protein [Corallibacter sp.]
MYDNEWINDPYLQGSPDPNGNPSGIVLATLIVLLVIMIYTLFK